jgi:uncharacterized repeat protein (TIGR01451 family)
MRGSWRRLVAALLVGCSLAGVLAAVAFGQAAIRITNLEARASGGTITSGPNGAGFDVFVAAAVTETSWSSTRLTIGGVSRCVDHDNLAAGNQTLTIQYRFENAVLREGPAPQAAVPGSRTQVFPPPPGGSSQLRVELFNNNSCGLTALASQSLTLTTQVPGTNEALIAACETLRVAVVLDESYSIEAAGATQKVRDATRALAQGLVGTGASMSVFKFNSTASNSFIAPYQPVTPSFITGTLATYLNNYRPTLFSPYTNWESGLAKVQAETQANRPDLVVFLTDGNPNRTGSGATDYEEGYYTPVNAAVGVADALKQRSHMFVVGVGTGVTDPLSALRIESVSGTRSFPTYPISVADYTLVTDFDALEDALRDLASNLCNVTVTVRKETDAQARDKWVSQNGWGFSGRVQLQGTTPFAYRWFEPNAVDPVNSSTATQSGVTGTDGVLRFVWRPTSAAALSDITISETVPATHAADSVNCQSGAATIFSSQDPATVASFTLPGLKVRDSVSCVVRNRVKRSTVMVVKQWDGPPASTTLFVDATGAAPYDASTTATATGDSASFDYPLSTAATVGETAVPAGYSATIACGTGVPQPYAGGPFAVASPAVDGAVLTCTIANRPQSSTVRVLKTWVGAPGSATIFVDADGSAPYDASAVSTSSGTTASFTYPVSTPATLGETAVPAGYSATIACDEGTPQPYTGGPFPVTSPSIDGGALTCLITNTQLLSTVRVVKNWAGAPATASIFVDADGTAPFDAQTTAAADGDNASFTYPVSTAVTVGEVAVPIGYTATIECGGGAAQPYAGGPFAVTSPATAGATLTCTINDAVIPPPPESTVRVIKDWEGAPASATIFVDANGAGPYDASTVATASGDSASFDYAPGSAVTVGETAVPAGYSATIACGGSGPQPYSGGPFAVTAPGTPATTLTCTITNTRLFAAVRVVKQWVGAPASATVFVDADGAAPYDASTVATASGQGASFTYPLSAPATVGETSVPIGYRATIACGQAAPQPYAGGAFAVTAPSVAGTTLTCTITNAQRRSSVRVVKDWAGTPSTATVFVDADGAAPYDASRAATATGDDASFSYPLSTPATVGEVAVPTGYSAAIACDDGAPQAYAGGPFAVTSPAVDGATATCTITNTPRATVRVVKNWVGRAASTEIFVDAAGRQPFDAATTAETDGESVSFDYAPSTPVTLGEAVVPPGYSAFVNCGTGIKTLRRYAGGPYGVTAPVTANGVVTCTVSNAVQFVPRGRVVIVKTASRRAVRAPGRVRFALTVRNRGPGTVRDIRVCDRLPKGVSLVSANGSRRANGSVCWRIARLPRGAAKAYRVTVRVGRTAERRVLVNVAYVSGANSVTCRSRPLATRVQRRLCSDVASVVLLPARKPKRAALPSRVRFTG